MKQKIINVIIIKLWVVNIIIIIFFINLTKGVYNFFKLYKRKSNSVILLIRFRLLFPFLVVITWFSIGKN